MLNNYLTNHTRNWKFHSQTDVTRKRGLILLITGEDPSTPTITRRRLQLSTGNGNDKWKKKPLIIK